MTSQKRARAVGVALTFLALILGTALPAGASTGGFNGATFWYRGGPTTLLWPNACANPTQNIPIARAQISSQILPNRTMHVGDIYYVQMEFASTTSDPCLAPQLSPHVSLPAGLQFATESAVRCYAILPPKTTWTEYLGACGLRLDRSRADSGSITGAFNLTPGAQWRVWLPVAARSAVAFDAPITAELNAVQSGVGASAWQLQGGTYVPSLPDALVSYWESLGGPSSSVGMPSTPLSAQSGVSPAGAVIWTEDWRFESGARITYRTGIGAHVVPAQIAGAWYPLIGVATSEATWANTHLLRQSFQSGSITYDSNTGKVTVYDCFHGSASMNC